MNGPSKGHNLWSEVKKKSTINEVNLDNKRGTAQSTLCVDNKKDKTELFLGFHEFRFKSVIPRLFRDGGKSLALDSMLLVYKITARFAICFNCCQPSCVQPTAVA